MSSSNAGIFIVWLIFQRRTESLAAIFNLSVKYHYCPWEEKTRLHKAWSYISKTVGTVRDLIRDKPPIVFIQLPPTPILYIVAAYCRMTHAKLVADCHNAMIYSKWLDWPLAKSLLRRVDAILVHNEDVQQYARQFQLDTIVLCDPLPNLTYTSDTTLIEGYQLIRGRYVIVPWSFAPNEPIKELIQAIRLTPDVQFVMTWFAEKLPLEIRNKLPSNLVLTGYLDDKDFNAIFSLASAALVLTTREGTQPSAASEAIVLGVPLIMSDLKTTRKLYADMPIYIENSVDGIRNGIHKTIAERDKYKAKILLFKNKFGNRLENEIRHVKLLLGLSDQDKEVSR